MALSIGEQIKKLSPFMDENSEIFRELSIFFGEGSKIPVNNGDLSKFIGSKRLFRVIRLKGESYKDCVYQLVDDYPESMDALGMLRYYKAPAGRILWEEVEKAEIAMGKELTTNAYGWMPDAWTLFQKIDPGSEAGMTMQEEIPGQARDDSTIEAREDCAMEAREDSRTHELVAILAFDFGE